MACEREIRKPQEGCIPNSLLPHQLQTREQCKCPNVKKLKTNKQNLERIKSRLHCSSQQASSFVSEKHPCPWLWKNVFSYNQKQLCLSAKGMLSFPHWFRPLECGCSEWNTAGSDLGYSRTLGIKQRKGKPGGIVGIKQIMLDVQSMEHSK